MGATERGDLMKNIATIRSRGVALANAVFVSAFLLTGSVALAEEGGSTLWPLGVETVVPAIFPPPDGTEFYQYDLYYSASSFKNGQGQSVYPNIGVDSVGNALRIAHTWSLTLGGFNFITDVTMISDGTTVKVGPSFQDTNVGVEEFYVVPLEATYKWGDVHFGDIHLGDLHVLASGGAMIPVSSYDPTRVVNASLNYYGINAAVAVTWFPTPKWDVSGQADFTFNFRNPATQYLSGDMFNMDFGIGYKPFDSLPGLEIGVNGFVTEQLTADQTAAGFVPGGNYLRKFAFGPQIIYYLSPAAALVFKWQRELEATNGPKGDRVWFEFAFPLGGSRYVGSVGALHESRNASSAAAPAARSSFAHPS
jgi:hypothetical protein